MAKRKPYDQQRLRLTCAKCGDVRMIVPTRKPDCRPGFACANRCGARGRKSLDRSKVCEINDHLDACEHCGEPMDLRSPYRRCDARKTAAQRKQERLRASGMRKELRSERSIGLEIGSMQP